MTKKKNASPLTGRQAEHLLWGWCLGNSFPFDNEEARRQAWFENRTWLLSLAGAARVDGIFGWYPLKKGQRPQAQKDYESKKRKSSGTLKG